MTGFEITLNNEKRKITPALPLLELLKTLPISNLEFGVAVCLNGEVVEKSLWEAVKLQSGDRVELLRAFQGG